MKLVCPLCNGLYKIDFNCSSCDFTMEDKVPLVHLMDDYSPYLLDEITHLVDGVNRNKCVHTYQCQNCGFKQNYSIERKEV